MVNVKRWNLILFFAQDKNYGFDELDQTKHKEEPRYLSKFEYFLSVFPILNAFPSTLKANSSVQRPVNEVRASYNLEYVVAPDEKAEIHWFAIFHVAGSDT